MLSPKMKSLIRNFSAGSVATVRADGRPAVSPKATFVIVDDCTLAYGDLRSPGTAANLRANPAVQVCFLDVLARRALRVTGQARVIAKDDAGAEILALFEASWAGYLPRMKGFVLIDMTAVEEILSPAYDVGICEQELRSSNLDRLNSLEGGRLSDI